MYGELPVEAYGKDNAFNNQFPFSIQRANYLDSTRHVGIITQFFDGFYFCVLYFCNVQKWPHESANGINLELS